MLKTSENYLHRIGPRGAPTKSYDSCIRRIIFPLSVLCVQYNLEKIELSKGGGAKKSKQSKCNFDYHQRVSNYLLAIWLVLCLVSHERKSFGLSCSKPPLRWFFLSFGVLSLRFRVLAPLPLLVTSLTKSNSSERCFYRFRKMNFKKF